MEKQQRDKSFCFRSLLLWRVTCWRAPPLEVFFRFRLFPSRSRQLSHLSPLRVYFKLFFFMKMWKSINNSENISLSRVLPKFICYPILYTEIGVTCNVITNEVWRKITPGLTWFISDHQRIITFWSLGGAINPDMIQMERQKGKFLFLEFTCKSVWKNLCLWTFME